MNYTRTPEIRKQISESVRKAFEKKQQNGERLGRPPMLPDVECLECGKEFRPSGTKKFCSPACAGRYKVSQYRTVAIKLLPHVCQKCGKNLVPREIHVHHADENRLNGDLENLQIVCVPCHYFIHKATRKLSRQMYGDRTVQWGVGEILKGLRLDLTDKNLQATPQRVSRMFLELFEGLFCGNEVAEILSTTFPSDYKGLIIHHDILVFSMCPHHLLPVEYSISVGYISDRTVGLSKLPRAIELLAKRPILQETLTKEIADALSRHLKAKGVMVIVRGKHSCMRIRGVKTLSDETITSSITGVMKESALRAECLQLMQSKKNGVL